MSGTVPTPVPLENFEHLPVITATPYEYGIAEPAQEGFGLSELVTSEPAAATPPATPSQS